jgi:hypothetical protein
MRVLLGFHWLLGRLDIATLGFPGGHSGSDRRTGFTLRETGVIRCDEQLVF